MKIILAQPSIKRFQWELEVLLTNIKQFGDFEVILLFSKPLSYDSTVPDYLANKYGCSVFVYEDTRFDKRYIPSIRPYLWWQHLKAHPEAENETYFYIDSDIIFRQWPKLDELGVSKTTWIGSDCSSYIDYNYLIKCKKGPEIVQKMAEICGITVEQMKAAPGIGAQLYIKNPTASFWERSYDDSLALYEYFLTLDSDIQKWTAEMWAQLWGMVREGKTLLMPKELDFCKPTDDIEKWDMVKIMHNAGVTEHGELFFKGNYIDRMPFGEDFSGVRKDKVSIKYVEALQKVLV